MKFSILLKLKDGAFNFLVFICLRRRSTDEKKFYLQNSFLSEWSMLILWHAVIRSGTRKSARVATAFEARWAGAGTHQTLDYSAVQINAEPTGPVVSRKVGLIIFARALQRLSLLDVYNICLLCFLCRPFSTGGSSVVVCVLRYLHDAGIPNLTPYNNVSDVYPAWNDR